ncbi:DUF1285 domain-containing protein [Psychrobacter halodurans]|uniref:DUF1285 domain-containing protein n=1 Tax=Psychrobacter halodurans TaxID=2818439 RepID=A0AAW4IPE2_9GAMM|nr:DUF1285 domain-containing protein [Psychrobacter halodurans]MBO1517327.1 DUF1285 domain-containing protein [Psychrobacter halodurans]
MDSNNKQANKHQDDTPQAPNDVPSALNSMDALSQYLKTTAGAREGRAIPPLERWHPEQVTDMDLVIKANGEWWHEGGQMTRESLVNLFATILWKEENQGKTEYFLKTPVQKIRIQVEDAPLLINDVGIVEEAGLRWLEFTTTTGDVIRLDDEHKIVLKAYNPNIPDKHAESQPHSDHAQASSAQANNAQNAKDQKQHAVEQQIRPYMHVRQGLMALIGRNTFYHLAEIGELTEQNGETILTLQSGGQSYQLSMP